MGWFKNLQKNVQGTLHAASVSIGNASQVAQHQIKAGIHTMVSGAEDIPFLALLPFKSMMEHELDKKGVHHTGTLHEVAPLFVEHIVKPSGHFESFESYDTGRGHNIIDEVATTVINAIINFIKQLKAKKDSGKPLSSTEASVLNSSQVVTAKVIDAGKSAAKDEAASKIQSFLFSWKGAAGLVGLGLVVALAVKGVKSSK
jgi:hypothetical protein